MTKKLHWTQTDEGRKRMSEIQKLSRDKIRAIKTANRKKKKSTKRSLTVTISGKDARQALAELLSNAQYDNLDVSITVERS